MLKSNFAVWVKTLNLFFTTTRNYNFSKKKPNKIYCPMEKNNIRLYFSTKSLEHYGILVVTIVAQCFSPIDSVIRKWWAGKFHREISKCGPDDFCGFFFVKMKSYFLRPYKWEENCVKLHSEDTRAPTRQDAAQLSLNFNKTGWAMTYLLKRL